MAIDGLVIDNYNNLTDKPIINQDLDGTFTAAANTYYRHTGTTGATYTQGVVYFYDGSTYTAVTGGSGGSGISDVKVNGASVVADGIANIPAASKSTDGVVTTDTQTFKGTKNLNGNLWLKNANSGGRLIFENIMSNGSYASIYHNSYGFCFCPDNDNRMFRLDTINGIYVTGVSYAAFPNISLGSSSYRWAKTYTRSLNNGEDIAVPTYSGTLMSKPTSYSSGTSGSLTLTVAGEYEFYFSNGTVNIDLGSINFASDTAVIHGVTTDYNQAYTLEITSAGVVTLNSIVIGTSKTPTTDTLYYRRKGI